MNDAERELKALIMSALAIADELGLIDVGIGLNSALVELDGTGKAPVEVRTVRSESDGNSDPTATRKKA